MSESRVSRDTYNKGGDRETRITTIIEGWPLEYWETKKRSGEVISHNIERITLEK